MLFVEFEVPATLSVTFFDDEVRAVVVAKPDKLFGAFAPLAWAASTALALLCFDFLDSGRDFRFPIPRPLDAATDWPLTDVAEVIADDFLEAESDVFDAADDVVAFSTDVGAETEADFTSAFGAVSKHKPMIRTDSN